MANVHEDKRGALAGGTWGDDQDELLRLALRSLLEVKIRLAYLDLEEALTAQALHRENHGSSRCSQAGDLPVDSIPWQNRSPSIESLPDGPVVHVQLSAVEMLPQKGASARAVKRHGARRAMARGRSSSPEAPRETPRSFMPDLLMRLRNGAGKGGIKAGGR